MSSCDYQYYEQDIDISRNQESYGSVRISGAVYEFVARESNGSWLSHFLLGIVNTQFLNTQFFIKLKDPRHSRAFWVNRALKQSILIIIIHIHSTLIQRSSCKNFIHIILANSAILTKSCFFLVFKYSQNLATLGLLTNFLGTYNNLISLKY